MAADKKTEKSKTIKELRKQQIQNIVLAIVTLIALLALGWAWFVNNTRVGAAGAQVTSEGDRFQLATKGTQGVYDEKNTILGTAKVIDDVTYYVTSGDKPSISWMVGADSNLNNNVGNKYATLQPDTSGSISFSVLPIATDFTDASVEYRLDMIPYKEYTGDETAKPVDAVTIGGKTYAPLDETDTAYKLLSGHLLFYGAYGQGARYSKLLETGVNFDSASLVKDSTTGQILHYDYTLHWVWPGWFREYVMRGSNGLYSTSTDVDQEYTSLITEVNENRDRFFYGYNEGNPLPNISADMSSADIDKAIIFYNDADELIGNSIQFVQLRLTAMEK